jgi:hypothetical protein
MGKHDRKEFDLNGRTLGEERGVKLENNVLLIQIRVRDDVEIVIRKIIILEVVRMEKETSCVANKSAHSAVIPLSHRSVATRNEETSPGFCTGEQLWAQGCGKTQHACNLLLKFAAHPAIQTAFVGEASVLGRR